MGVVIPQKELQKVLDQVTREVTEKVAGIRLYEGAVSPGKDRCTVYSTCEGGLHFSLALSVETSMLIRLTRHIMQEKEVTAQNVEDFTKDFFSVLCGNIAAWLFQITRVASRFGPPIFKRGSLRPEGQNSRFVLEYFSGQNECVQLIHYISEAE